MSLGEILSIIRDAVNTAAVLAAPVLAATAGLGIGISILQAATQIQEQSVSFIVKIVSVGLIIVLLSSWGITLMMDYTNRIFEIMSNLS